MEYYRRSLLLFCCLLFTASARAELPPTGYSLFDRLFSKQVEGGYVYDIPYPFEKLLERLRQQAAAYESDSESPLVTSLIPRGRSLQREAASPDYFKFPRVVVALDQDSRLPIPTKNRLFLGFQEIAETIEIISYNESAGRFEFQVVDNYNADGKPRVRYASRDLCTSCHQNLAPIFARPRWRESNFNNDVARLIGEHHETYHGVAAMADKGDAARFDFATDQAGLFNSYQRVWQQGCETDRGPEHNRGCRAGLFFAVIQHALASIPRPRYRSALIEENLLPLLRENWQRRWPDGMPVASADIADRKSPGAAEVDRVTSQQDPLSRRPMLASWSYKPALRRSIQGIGEQFLLLQDLIHLNATMLRKAESGDLPQQHLEGYCRVQQTPANETGRWINLDCRLKSRQQDGISIEGELWQANYDQTSAGRGKLLLTGTAGWARVEVQGSLEQLGGDRLRFNLSGVESTRAARLWDNRIVSNFEITLPSSAWDETTRLPARITLSDDFNLVEAAIYQMLDDARAGRLDVFDNRPLPGAELMRSLLRQLGAEPDSAPGLLPIGLERHATTAASSGATMLEALPQTSPLRLVFQHCASCHSSEAQMPPGFLHGDINLIKARLRQCAPRIALRLAMWQQHEDERLKSPMPPPSSVNRSGGEWPQSVEFGQLQQYIASLLPTTGGASLEAEDYDLLPRCLGEGV